MIKLIIVDDEYMVLQGLQRLIDWESLGIEIVGTFTNGMDALQYMSNHDVDLVITDVTMPVMSGLEFIQKAREENQDFYFIIISGYQDFNYVVEGLRLGAENYLVKPIDRSELAKNVKQVLKKIDDRKQLEKSFVSFLRDTLIRWVNNDIESDELEKNLSNTIGFTRNTAYTVVALSPINQKPCDIIDFLDPYDQKYRFKDEFGNVIAIIDHSNEQHYKLVRDIVDGQGKMFKVGMGETIHDVMDVHVSYEHAVSALELLDFYDMTKNDCLYLEQDMTISLKDYNTALEIRDLSTIVVAIDEVFDALEAKNAHPGYVRHISFMMYNDLRRSFELSKDQESEKTLKRILSAETKHELQTILLHAVQHIKNEIQQSFYNPNVQEVIRIIMESYDQDLTLKAIAESLHLNTMYLGQLIKKETGKTFSQYLNTCRIRQAQKLLLTTDMNINEITYTVGYASSGYFYKNFKRICGVSPTEFKSKFADDYNPLINI